MLGAEQNQTSHDNLTQCFAKYYLFLLLGSWNGTVEVAEKMINQQGEGFESELHIHGRMHHSHVVQVS